MTGGPEAPAALVLDHLAVVAPTLGEGVAHVRACLGLDLQPGGRHPEMGTHNRLLRLGGTVFLEVIAVDPEAPPPERARWFGLDDAGRVRSDWAAGRRLRGLVARTGDLDRVLDAHRALLGEAARISRGALSWRFGLRSDGAWPADGAAPHVMDWGPAGTPAGRMPDLGARLVGTTLTHPDPAAIARLHEAIGFAGQLDICAGPAPRLSARIATPTGIRTLT